MQGLQTHHQLHKIKKSELPSWVIEEVFPIFEEVLSSEMSVIVGVSGGVDSMSVACLLLLWYQDKGFALDRVQIVHCNHKMRKQSEEEAAYVKEFFSWLKVQIFERTEEVLCREKALREWRYGCFKNVCYSNHKGGSSNPPYPPFKKGAVLLLGHHLEDRIESSFLNAVRGCGFKGFLNMQVLQEVHPLFGGAVCRPLLNVTKQQIIGFCEQFGVRYFEDETNADLLTSQRNFLRKEVIQRLVGMNGGKSRFLESMKQVYEEIEGEVHQGVHKLVPIPTFPSRNAEYGYRVWGSANILQLRHHLGIATNLRSSQVEEWTKWLEVTRSGRKEFHGVYFFFHEGELYVIKAGKRFWKAYVGEEKKITKLWLYTLAWITVEVGEERLIGAVLRFPRVWDRFAGKSWNRWCINQKIPLRWRNCIPVAEKEGKILHMWKEVLK